MLAVNRSFWAYSLTILDVCGWPTFGNSSWPSFDAAVFRIPFEGPTRTREESDARLIDF